MITVAADAVDGRPDQRYLDLIDIDVRRNAFGRQVASFESEIELAGDPTPFPGVFIRAPWIERAGAGSRCSQPTVAMRSRLVRVACW